MEKVPIGIRQAGANICQIRSHCLRQASPDNRIRNLQPRNGASPACEKYPVLPAQSRAHT